MKHIVHHQPDLYYDSIPFLVRLYNDDDVTEVRTRFSESSGAKISETELAPYFDDIIALNEEIGQQVDLSSPLARLLFARRDEVNPLAYALWRYHRCYDKASTKIKRRLILGLVDDLEDEREDDSRLGTDALLFAWIESTALSKEVKHDLALFYLQFELCEEYLCQLVDIVSAILRPKLPLFQRHIDLFILQMNRDLEAKGLGFIEQWSSIKLDENDTYHIYPSLGLSAMVFCSNFAERNLMMFGIHMHALFELRNKHNRIEARLIDFFKALSDNTKLSILIRLKQERLYSGQLAEALKLSGPTISHHMSNLVQLQLVSMEKRGARAYYDLNASAIQSHIEELQRLLL